MLDESLSMDNIPCQCE